MKVISGVSLAAIIIALIVLGPFATIWALNTLFPALAIEYSLATWGAVIVLSSVLKSNVKVNS